MTQLIEGQKAPEFKSKNQNGDVIELRQLLGKKIILYFYPKDNTPGCTTESCNLRDHYNELQKREYEVIGVSCDDEKSHQKFIKKYNLPFNLLADTDKKIVNDYGVWGPKAFMGRFFTGIHRTTFIIDEKGMIEKIIRKVDTKNHSKQIFEPSIPV